MKFRTIRRFMYLKRARHRRGHGIHSPFLFHLITEVVEDKRKLPEYEFVKKLKNKAIQLLDNCSDASFTNVYQQFNLALSNPHQLYKKVELPFRYAKVVFRLIREFKPSVIANYGPTFGVNLALMAIADNNSIVYQLINDASCNTISKELLNDSAISNIRFFHEDSVLTSSPEFIYVNYPGNPGRSRSVIQIILENHGADDVLIIRGIHESAEMEIYWMEVIESGSVHVSLDLFEIGIVLFRKGLQKENFIHRF
jgi:hypothetical protein